MRRLLLPLLLGLAHGVADGAAGLMLGRLPGRLPTGEVALLVLLYNLLAFVAQPLLGYLTDQLRRPRAVAVGGLALLGAAVALASRLPLQAVLLAGLGSGTFHVGGGALALCATRGRAAGPGLFAAPGVAGLALGGWLAITGVWPPAAGVVWALLAVLALALLASPLPALPYDRPAEAPVFEPHDWVMLALLAGIALRSLVWATLQAVLQARVDVLLALGLAAAVGKVCGGFLADWLGWRRWTVGALGLAAVLVQVGAGRLWALALGVALLQSATPAAMAAALRLRPGQPALVAGLALGLAIGLGALPLLGGGAALLGQPLVLGLAALLAAALMAVALARRRLGALSAQSP